MGCAIVSSSYHISLIEKLLGPHLLCIGMFKERPLHLERIMQFSCISKQQRKLQLTHVETCRTSFITSWCDCFLQIVGALRSRRYASSNLFSSENFVAQFEPKENEKKNEKNTRSTIGCFSVLTDAKILCLTKQVSVAVFV